MGKTLAALKSGSTAYKLIAKIEGYGWLLSDAVASAAVTACAGGDWTQALSGLCVDLQQQQQMNPWDPLQGGGTATLYVPADQNDQFGIDTHCTASGAETTLEQSADRDDTTLVVASTQGFGAAGTAYIGTESFSYTGVTGTSFTGVTRGMWSPFAAYGAGAPRFSHDHRVGLVDYATTLKPVVTALPRTWIGRWVGIWAHRIGDGGVIDTVADAHLLFAGKIIEVRDDPATLSTVVLLRHALDVIKEGVIGRDQYSAEAIEGHYIPAGWTWRMRTDNGSGTVKQGNDLTSVASGAVAPNQINAGYYTLYEIYDFINAWWSGEVSAGRIYQDYYNLACVDGNGGALKSKIYWNMSGVAGHGADWYFELPSPVADILGFTGLTAISDSGPVNTDIHRDSANTPSVGSLAYQPTLSAVGDQIHVGLANEVGVFTDNYAVLPANLRPPDSLSLDWGIFLIDNKIFLLAAKVHNELHYVSTVPIALAGLNPLGDTLDHYVFRPLGSTDGPITIKQVYVIEATFAALLKLLCYGTGTAGYNHPTYDTIGRGYGLGLPGGILGANFDAAVDALPGATISSVAVIEKATKLGGDEGLIASDLIIRRAFPIWKTGCLRFTTWSTPTNTNVTVALDDATKAAPAGNTVDHRAVTTLSAQYQRDIVKIEYQRDITQLQSTGYQRFLQLEDSVAIDDAGGEGAVATISARNTYSQYAQTGAGIEELAPGFLATFPLFSRPVRLMRRSIDPRFFEDLAPGDIVAISDKFARDPLTGRRQIFSRPGLITRHTYVLGGRRFGADTPATMAGEIDVFFLDTNRIAAYAPAARLDETAITGGFTAGYNVATKTMRCRSHEYSEAAEIADAANFAAGDAVLVTQLDSQAPLQWIDNIASVAGNDVTLVVGLVGFDATKLYVFTYGNFGDCVVSQQSKAFETDTDGLVSNTAPPFQYGIDGQAGTYTASLHTDVPDVIAATLGSVDGDGWARDVAIDKHLCRLVNNLQDHKTRHVGPSFAAAGAMTNTTYAGGFLLVGVVPVFLTKEISTQNTTRYLKMAPWFRSATGAAITVRVTLAPTMPQGASDQDIAIPAGSYSQIWTTSSSTWQQGAPSTFSSTIKNSDGIAFVLIELSLHAETYGLGQCEETERVFFP